MGQRVFLTGFGPFGSVGENPTTLLVRDSGLPSTVLEVSWDAVNQFLIGLDETSFDVLLMLGVAAGREQMCAELFARNHAGQTDDVRGVNRFGLIDEGGPLLLESTLWNPAITAELSFEDTLKTSYDAGNYLCNFSYYRALRLFPSRRVGFLHVPTFEKMPIEAQKKNLVRILELVV